MALSYVLPSYLFLNSIPTLRLLRPIIKYPSAKTNKFLASSFLNTLEINKTAPSTSRINIQHPVPTSAYVHLPFCKKRCFYCDFPIVALGSGEPPPNPQGSQHDPRMENYTNLICKEIAAIGSAASDSMAPLETVFFGGGTPSLIPASLLAHIIECLRKQFGIITNSEISIEMDPGTFNAQTLRQFMDLGINRVSLGVQAFQESLLRSCGRSHGLKEVYEAIEIVKSSGIQNWSLDLISSLPHQTLEDWEQSLQQAIDAGPAHMSIYDLQVEKGTKFGLLYKPGQSPLPSEDDSAKFYRLASRSLQEAGYGHYEISNYAKEGFQCRHNLVYWKNLPYYGFGLGATSYVGGLRLSRPRKMKDYALFVDKGYVGRGNESEVFDSKDLAMDTIMLSLRLAQGLDIRTFGKVFGLPLCLSLCRVLKPFVASGHLIVLNDDRQSLCAEVFDLFCNDLRQEEIIPSKFVQQNLENKYAEVLDRDGLDVLYGVEERSVSDVRNQIAYIRLSDPEGFLLSNELISTAFAALMLRSNFENHGMKIIAHVNINMWITNRGQLTAAI
ncbi:hypothetical protein SUGI_0770370 [Cryptomeria japonica]|uniref:uncharacterized protein LOC131040250 n=1 Tax=Cryptomeria japonica TaxID=3369 RepID=UPI0024148537|nr:uncharacterized protein LOC131040250 [Cryptomeria japonica]GLJ37866.1 hypothetical protein SUGI_0770370 [Cryptomeria japonica]